MENVTPRLKMCFFFQAEDGIRDADVTGVQTCALPIWLEYGRHKYRADQCLAYAKCLQNRVLFSHSALYLNSGLYRKCKCLGHIEYRLDRPLKNACILRLHGANSLCLYST